MDRRIESKDCMQAEGGKVCPSESNNVKPRDNDEQRPDNRDSASNLKATEHTGVFSDSASPANQPLSTASGPDSETMSNPKNSERNLLLPLSPQSNPMANIPSLQVDSSQCHPSISSSNESLQEAKKDTLDVDYQQKKRKFKPSPVKEKFDDSGSSGGNDEMERTEGAGKQRAKKTPLMKIFSRKSPKSRETSPKESAAKGSRSQSRSPSRSPSPSKSKNNKGKPSKKSLSPSDRRSKDARRARSPVAQLVGSIHSLLKKRPDSETEALCAAQNSDSDPPKVQVPVKEKKAVGHMYRGPIPADFELSHDVNLSDTTCDSQSTHPSLVSTDSNPLPDETPQIEDHIDDQNDTFEE